MMTAVPAVIVATMPSVVVTLLLGMRSAEQPWNSCPGLDARAMMPVDCSTARPTVR